MEVVKAFNANELHTEIIIKGTFEEPLFRASDIGAVLEMGNIRTSIADFDKSEKDDIHTMDSVPTPTKKYSTAVFFTSYESILFCLFDILIFTKYKKF